MWAGWPTAPRSGCTSATTPPARPRHVKSRPRHMKSRPHHVPITSPSHEITSQSHEVTSPSYPIHMKSRPRHMKSRPRHVPVTCNHVPVMSLPHDTPVAHGIPSRERPPAWGGVVARDLTRARTRPARLAAAIARFLGAARGDPIPDEKQACCAAAAGCPPVAPVRADASPPAEGKNSTQKKTAAPLLLAPVGTGTSLAAATRTRRGAFSRQCVLAGWQQA